MNTNRDHLKRANSKDPDFLGLVEKLDQELAVLDGEDHAFYDQFNKLDSIKYVVLLYEGKDAVSCGAIKEYDPETVEVKRMYTDSKFRGKSYAAKVLEELELWAKELGFSRCILETGIRQLPAIRLYVNCGYNQIPNYGQYAGVEESLCFEKVLCTER